MKTILKNRKSLPIIFGFNFLILVFVCCSLAHTADGKPCSSCGGAGLSTVEGMRRYIAPLPAVWDVQIWDNSYGDGLVIDTKHYRIYTTLLEPLMLKQIPAFVEAAYNQYQSQLPAPVVDGRRFEVYLFKDRVQWEAFTKCFTGAQWPIYQKIKKGAYFLNGVCVTYNIGRSRTFGVLGHEGWHQFCNRYFKYRLPSWLDEGIAQLFETSDFDKGKFVFTPAKNYQRLGALKLTMSGGMIPLEKLITLNPGQVVSHHDADRAVLAFYAQSYALVRFLKEDNYSKRLPRYHNMLSGALMGTWPLDTEEAKIASDRSIVLTADWNGYIGQKIFNLYITEDINSLERAYQRFCQKLVYRIRLKSEK